MRQLAHSCSGDNSLVSHLLWGREIKLQDEKFYKYFVKDFRKILFLAFNSHKLQKGSVFGRKK